MSLSSLIIQYGRTATVERQTMTRSTAGGPSVSSTAQTTATVLIQVGGGGSSRRYGADRGAYDATGYCEATVDVRSGDFMLLADDDSMTRRYRVESVRIPDERVSGDALRYRIFDMSEDLPRT